MTHRLLFLSFGVLTALGSHPATADDYAEAVAKISRRLPPQGIQLPATQQEQLRQAADKLTRLRQLASEIDHPYLPDATVLLKAVDLALEHHEFYRPNDVGSADELLQLAEERLQSLKRGQAPWRRERGLVVRGYRSSVDGSVQPYGLEAPEDIDWRQPAKLLVWLHGRGDKTTDLHFIQQRRKRRGQAHLQGALVLHPFGRQCVGYKSAGETDVLEAIEHVCREYAIDKERIVLMGFSMGGAGAWHVGAHYADHWAALSPGAGFAETRLYNRIADDALPPRMEQKMWGVYDAPNYVRNLFNIPVVAYSGENDKQIQAARVMEDAYQSGGRVLPHRIGPGMGHKYHPEVLSALLEEMNAAANKGRPQPREVTLQTRTLRYSQMYWVKATGLMRHWDDSRIDAQLTDNVVRVTTKNIRSFEMTAPAYLSELDGTPIVVDGQRVEGAWNKGKARLHRQQERWLPGEDSAPLQKRPKLQGPMDDVFRDPFLVVAPNFEANKEPTAVDRWTLAEFEHFQRRWRALMRGELRVKQAADVTADDLKGRHVVLWGRPAANPWLRRILATGSLPLKWNEQGVTLGNQSWGPMHVPCLVYPNPLAPNRYVLLNSGLTFREDHDRTNSLQNPKLGDWAVLDIRQLPTGSAAGKIVATGLFDEYWNVAR